MSILSSVQPVLYTAPLLKTDKDSIRNDLDYLCHHPDHFIVGRSIDLSQFSTAFASVFFQQLSI
ncbi:TPA: hypothetical protein EYN65_21360 [Candidatus Poribacteria bacterium]|nr:hypothetical protein [Candidatus Poribacteria bacterium]HIM10827.1 hypothetical protein [Candidatus Poribacteria bacterium]HIO79293.1 hypothetical protein [Candidatus Poribacteria bacterium]